MPRNGLCLRHHALGSHDDVLDRGLGPAQLEGGNHRQPATGPVKRIILPSENATYSLRYLEDGRQVWIPIEPARSSPAAEETRETSRETKTSSVTHARILATKAVAVVVSVRCWLKKSLHLKLCYIIIAGVLLSICTSTIVGIWWTIKRHDISGGFTLAGFITTATNSPLGFVHYQHRPACKCWRTEQSANDIELRNLTSNVERRGHEGADGPLLSQELGPNNEYFVAHVAE